jgi:ketosteroid isomerase-like protein
MKKLLGIAIVILSMLGAVYAQCSTADKSALEALDRAWAKANETGDRAALMNIYSDNFSNFAGSVGKKEAVDNAMAGFEARKKSTEPEDDVSYDRYMITCTPVSAMVTHRTIISTQNGAGGKPETYWSRSIHVLEKSGGKWQVVSTTGHDMDDYMTLEYLEQDWNDANKARDTGWFEKNFAPDYVSVSSSSGEIFNKAEDIASVKNDKSTIDLTETTGVNVRIDRNTAVVTGTYRWKGKDEKGVAFDNKIRYIDTWVKRGGRWMVLATIGTPIK